MRVLWFSVTPSLFMSFNNGHNGGGWIASLERLVRNIPDVELGIAFDFQNEKFKNVQEGVTYYPIHVPLSPFRRFSKFFSPLKFEADVLIPHCLKIIEDFRPDIIHIFGSENYFGLLSFYTSVPVIVHMQGCLPAYYNARYPVTVSFKDILCSKHYSVLDKLIECRNLRVFNKRAQREEAVLRQVNNFFGRTHWDKSITRIYNPQSRYFYCGEVLRDVFYTGKSWSYPAGKRITLVSTLSAPLYKGLDVVLKTAKILKTECHLNFTWKVLGVSKARFVESHYHIEAADVSVELLGCVSADQVLEELLQANFYVHPSYIDNSPNSVCEAQMLGVPVVCCNVGGVASLVEDGETGFLLPANDPIKMADVINQYAVDRAFLEKMSVREMAVAKQRHAKEQILSDLLNAYKELCGENDKDRSDRTNQ